MTDEWPSFAAELSRKTTEQLEIASDRFDRGVISLPAMISVVSALYDATSGLIEKDVSDLMADLHRDLLAQARKR